MSDPEVLQEILRKISDVRERLIFIEVRAAESSRRTDENRARIEEVARVVDVMRSRMATIVTVAGFLGALAVSLFNSLLRRLSG